MLDINTRSTVALLEGALASSSLVKRFLLASTDQTYNPFVTKQVTFHEDSPQIPADIYALTKLLSEANLPGIYARVRTARDNFAL